MQPDSRWCILQVTSTEREHRTFEKPPISRDLRVLVFPDDELSAFNCALTLLLRHSLVDLYRPATGFGSHARAPLQPSLAGLLVLQKHAIPDEAWVRQKALRICLASTRDPRQHPCSYFQHSNPSMGTVAKFKQRSLRHMLGFCCVAYAIQKGKQ